MTADVSGQEGGTQRSERSARQEGTRRIEPLRLPQRLEGQLKPSQLRFAVLTDAAIAQVEKVERSGKPFPPEKRERLRAFGAEAYHINAMMSGGHDNFAAAKIALAYEIGREQYHEGQDRLFGGAYGYANAQNTPRQVFMESDWEIAEAGRTTGKPLELMDTDDAKMVGSYMDILKQVHSMREALLQGASLKEFSKMHPYIPLIATIYLLTNHVLEERGFQQGQVSAETAGSTLQRIAGMHGKSLAEHELGALAFQLPYAEHPPTEMMAADFQTRTYWSRMINGTRDHILSEYFPEAAALVDDVVGEVTGMTDYSERVFAANSLQLQQFIPGAKAPVAIASTRPFYPTGSRVGLAPFWMKGRERQGLYMYPPGPDVQLLDRIIEPQNRREIQLQQSGIKSMWEILGKTLKVEGIASQLEALAGQLLPPLSPELTAQLHDPRQVIMLQSRIQLLNELLRSHADNEQVRTFVEQVRQSVAATPDMIRSRAFFTENPGDLDKFCKEHIKDDPDAFVLLWYPQGRPQQIVSLKELLDRGESVEALFDQIRNTEKPDNPSFVGVFIHREVTLPGSTKPVKAEFHFGRRADAQRNWEARQEYKFDA